MKLQLRYILAVSSLFIFQNTIFTTADAAEGGTETYLLGSRDSMAGALPPPGTYFKTDFQYYSATTGTITAGGIVAVTPSVKTKVSITNITHVTNYQVFGASLGLSVSLPVAYAAIDITGGIPGFLTGRLSDTQFGMGDPVVTPILGWHSEKFHTILSASVFLPLGNYNPAVINVPARTIDVLNIGKNRFAVDPTLSVTYLDPDTGFELSGAAGITFSAMNKTTNYQNAPEFHFEGTIAQHLPGGWVAGLTGYAYHQLGDDSGAGAISTKATIGASSLQAQVYGVGPVLTYSTKIGGRPVSFRTKYIMEFGAKRKFEGDRFWLSMSFPL